MKIAVVFVAFVAVAVAAPQGTLPKTIRILQHDEIRDEYGQFALRYLSEDGTKVTEQGKLVPNADKTGYVLVLSGSEEHFAPDGKRIKLIWTADDQGFHPVGDHLPVAPIA